jgi:uncharacterized protein (TIGR02271 family)
LKGIRIEIRINRVPLIEEKINVSKRKVPYKEAALIKEPVTEIKTMKVTLTYEELIAERRPPTEATTSRKGLRAPVTSKEEIKIPLKKEEVIVKKEPFVKKEVAIKKRRMDERKTKYAEKRIYSRGNYTCMLLLRDFGTQVFCL